MTPNWQAAYRGRRVMLTGATGFIGRHLARALSLADADVCLVSRSGSERRHGSASGKVMSVQADLSTTGVAPGLVAEFEPAITFNLAGYGVDPVERDVALAERLNAEWPHELAVACAAHRDATWPGQHVVHAGSALEYGTASGDLGEDTAPQATTLYGTTKLAGTRALLAAATANGLRATVARLFTVYGPGEHPGRLLPSLLRAGAQEGSLPLTAGTQRRDFTWVGDVVDGLLRLGAVEGGSGGIVNLATGRLSTVREFVEEAAPLIGIEPGRLDFGALPTRPEEMAHAPIRVSRLVTLTGWRPTTSIAEGVRRTLDEP